MVGRNFKAGDRGAQRSRVATVDEAAAMRAGEVERFDVPIKRRYATLLAVMTPFPGDESRLPSIIATRLRTFFRRRGTPYIERPVFGPAHELHAVRAEGHAVDPSAIAVKRE